MATEDDWVIRAVDDSGEPISEPIILKGTATKSSANPGFEDTDGDDVAELQTAHADAKGGDLRNVGALGAKQASVSNETFIRATRSSDSASTASGTFVNAFDGESKDTRGEFNASQEFVPDESGEYVIAGFVAFSGSTVDGDYAAIHVKNVSTGAVLKPRVKTDVAAFRGVPAQFNVNLTAGDRYIVRATNHNSSFKIESSDTEMVIKRSVVQ